MKKAGGILLIVKISPALPFYYYSVRTDESGFTRKFKVYECDSCTGWLFRSSNKKAKEGNNRKLMVNAKWEQQKNM